MMNIKRVETQRVLHTAPQLPKKRRFVWILLLLGCTVLLSLLLAVCIGIIPLNPGEVYRIILYKLFGLNFEDAISRIPLAHIDIVWQIRLPRVLMALVAGAGLAVCGTVLQATVENPLAEPYILGISSGASMGATFAILFGGLGVLSGFGTAFWAFWGALAAAVLVMILSSIGGRPSTVKIILSGAVVSTVGIALTNLFVYLSNNAEGIQAAAFWTMGSLASSGWRSLLLPATGITICCAFFMMQPRILNGLLLGEEAAVTLGIDLVKVRRCYMIVVSLMTGLIVSACGILGFVGLMIPHIVRNLVGSDHRRLIPAVILVGMIFLTWADVLARTVLPSGELPIGIITSLIGAPFFISILLKQTFRFKNQ